MRSGLFNITTIVRGILLADQKVKELIGDRMYPVFAPQETKGDFIIYFRDKYEIDRTKMGIAQQQCDVFLAVLSDNYDRSTEIADAVFQALEGVFTNPDITIHLTDSTEDSIDGKYLQLLKFNIKEK